MTKPTKPADVDAAIYAAIAAGHQRRSLCKVTGINASDIAASIQRLRWSGRVKMDRLAINELSGSIPAVVTVAAAVKAEAIEAGSRRQQARSTGTVKRTLGRQAIELIQGEMLEDPADAAAMLARRWKSVWQSILQASRVSGATPVQAMIEALESQFDDGAETLNTVRLPGVGHVMSRDLRPIGQR